MIAVDTNILVYAHRRDSPFHDAALQRMTELAEGRSAWALPWPCLHEFIGIVTHPRIYKTPTPLAGALDQVMPGSDRRALRCSPKVPTIGRRSSRCCSHLA